MMSRKKIEKMVQRWDRDSVTVRRRIVRIWIGTIGNEYWVKTDKPPKMYEHAVMKHAAKELLRRKLETYFKDEDDGVGLF